jgi:hypothetical protein
MRFTREQIAAVCRQKGLLVRAQGLDPVKLLWGLAGVESSFGAHANPRHENGYCRGGIHFDRQITEEIGCAAHCSWGPWQVMYANTRGYNWIELHTDPDVAGDALVQFLNREIFSRFQIADLAAFYKHYNGPAAPPEYLAQLIATYNTELPA